MTIYNNSFEKGVGPNKEAQKKSALPDGWVVEYFYGLNPSFAPFEDNGYGLGVTVETFDYGWKLPSLSGSQYNESWISEFDISDLAKANFRGNTAETFEEFWGNEPGPYFEWEGIESERANFSTLVAATVPWEDFEYNWYLGKPEPNHAGPAALDGVVYLFQDSSDAIEIVANVNDTLSLWWENNGTLNPITIQIPAGTYTRSNLASTIESLVDAQLNTDPGEVSASDFQAGVYGNWMVFVNTSRHRMWLVQPNASSFYDYFGVDTSWINARYSKTYNADTAIIDGNPYEAFEVWYTTWKDTFGAADLARGTFDSTGDPYEDFESEWTTTL